MKSVLSFILFLCFQFSLGQHFYISIDGTTESETKTIDSLTYLKKHTTVALLIEEQKRFETLLTKQGYLDATLIQQKKSNDSSFVFQYRLGHQMKFNIIYIGALSEREKKILQLTTDSLSLPFTEVESFLTQKINLLEKQGFSLATLQLTNQQKSNNRLLSNLVLKLNSKRTLNELIIVGYDQFPAGIKKAIAKKAKTVTFNQENVKQIHNEFDKLPFVRQKKYPEILFTTDSTKIFVYIEKSKPNKFDGFIGFSNDDQSQISFNGYLDLQLQNIFNSGEKINVYWKNDGNQQTSFNLGTELPYAFNSPIGVKANLRIFKQDSTFQNTITDLNVGYLFSYNTKAYLGYQKSNSVSLQDNNVPNITNFSASFITGSFEHLSYKREATVFPELTKISTKFGWGNRSLTFSKSNQFFGQVEISHHFEWDQKNSLFIKNQSYYLQSNEFVINELLRFGGINSIRGFNENSLQANVFSGIMAEYRYLLASNLYVHTITDYGYMQDKTTSQENKLLGLGFGFGLFTKNGLFNLIYANGSTSEQTIKLSNSIVHISFKTNF
jgi:hypothetical protein